MNRISQVLMILNLLVLTFSYTQKMVEEVPHYSSVVIVKKSQVFSHLKRERCVGIFRVCRQLNLSYRRIFAVNEMETFAIKYWVLYEKAWWLIRIKYRTIIGTKHLEFIDFPPTLDDFKCGVPYIRK